MAKKRPLQCPYCDAFLRTPVEIDSGTIDLTGGFCPCGAVYAIDRTGHNQGELLMNTLNLACRGDLDKSLTLGPEDYEMEEYDYDMHTNTTTHASGSARGCKLLFIRLCD
ncbi:MAG: hypothetical protein ISR96_12110 [Nitrospira sp.]|nr:hypothetical protein [bacterium]MBL7050248.1 hypothetical protein [Nitrospira sp.]